MVDTNVIGDVDSLVVVIVSTLVKTDVYVTVDTGTVMLLVNLDTDVDTGTTCAPLRRLEVLVTT